MSDAPDDYYEDQYYDETEEHCDHADAELSWEGDFECPCGHSWNATVEQMDEYWRHYDQDNRPLTLRERIAEWWYWNVAQRIKRIFRSRIEREMDDDIPF